MYLSKRLYWWAYFWEGLLLEGVLRFTTGSAYIWKADFASEIVALDGMWVQGERIELIAVRKVFTDCYLRM